MREKNDYKIFGYTLIVNVCRSVTTCQVAIQEPNRHSFLIVQMPPLTCSIRLTLLK